MFRCLGNISTFKFLVNILYFDSMMKFPQYFMIWLEIINLMGIHNFGQYFENVLKNCHFL